MHTNIQILILTDILTLMIDSLRELVTSLSENVPLEILAFIVGFLSEAIPPIPSFPLLILIGVFAKIQSYTLPAVFAIALLSATGKTLVGIFIYRLTDKAEDVFISKYGDYFNIKPGQLDKFGGKFGKRKSDYVLITLIRGIPFLSATVLTVAAGLLKIPFRLFLITAFLGSFIQDSFYLYVGFTGINVFKKYFSELGYLNIFIICLFVIGIAVALTYLHLHKQKRRKASEVGKATTSYTEDGPP